MCSSTGTQLTWQLKAEISWTIKFVSRVPSRQILRAAATFFVLSLRWEINPRQAGVARKKRALEFTQHALPTLPERRGAQHTLSWPNLFRDLFGIITQHL